MNGIKNNDNAIHDLARRIAKDRQSIFISAFDNYDCYPDLWPQLIAEPVALYIQKFFPEIKVWDVRVSDDPISRGYCVQIYYKRPADSEGQTILIKVNYVISVFDFNGKEI